MNLCIFTIKLEHNMNYKITFIRNTELIILVFFLFIIVLLMGCNGHESKNTNLSQKQQDSITELSLNNDIVVLDKGYGKSFKGEKKTIPQPVKLKKVIYYLENSESMFGYVNGPNEYVSVVSELAEKPEFVDINIPRDFNFINGGANVKITKIGSNSSSLRNKLNIPGFRCGDITKSNLNGMIQLALEKAGNGSITILISDCIYDIGQPNAPFNALATQGVETRSKFIQRLSKGDIQTIIIKLNSKFNGTYFYTSKKGKITINQQRPFYIFIFGESKLLNKYFPESYISRLKGYKNSARFFKSVTNSIPYQATTENMIGSFRFDENDFTKLKKVKSGIKGMGFQFSIAVDYYSLPFSVSYLTAMENYAISSNYTIKSINKLSKNLLGLKHKRPFLITAYSSTSPYGTFVAKLKNNIPEWIEKTNINNENSIDGLHTFGFKYLTDAIIEAYNYKNKQKNITEFKFEIIK
jgi:hypothetical protein